MAISSQTQIELAAHFGAGPAAEVVAILNGVEEGASTATGFTATTDGVTVTLGGIDVNGGDIDLAASSDIVIATSTGSKIGTGVTQLIGFWNTTPVVQPAAALQDAITNSTGGTGDGTLAAISGSSDDANINNNFTDLHELLDAIRTALVDCGIMKGAA